MMKKEKELLVAIASQKGGVGKSVFTVLLASVLHYRKDVRVAVVDCDSPQHSIALMRERDMENVMKNDDLKVNLYRQYERIRKPAYPVIKSDPEKGVEDLRRYMDEKGETFDIVLFDLPGTLRSEGVVHTVAAMDYIFVPLKADNIVMQSSLQFTKVLEEELIAKGNCNLKGIRLFWNMVDRRGRKNLYDAWNRVIHRMGLRLLSSHIPNTLRYNKEADPVCKGVFRSTLFPPDPRQEKDSGLPELVEEICHAIGLEESDTERIRLFWNMVDRRGRKNLYDAWNRVIHRMGLRLLSSHIPNTLRYNKEADPVCKGVFRSTLFPPDPRQEKDSGLPELVEEICHAIGLEESDTER